MGIAGDGERFVPLIMGSGDVELLLPLTGVLWWMLPLGIKALSLLLKELTCLSPLSNGSSGSSKCLLTVFAIDVVLQVDV